MEVWIHNYFINICASKLSKKFQNDFDMCQNVMAFILAVFRLHACLSLTMLLHHSPLSCPHAPFICCCFFFCCPVVMASSPLFIFPLLIASSADLTIIFLISSITLSSRSNGWCCILFATWMRKGGTPTIPFGSYEHDRS
jgi:hypothetical protein